MYTIAQYQRMMTSTSFWGKCPQGLGPCITEIDKLIHSMLDPSCFVMNLFQSSLHSFDISHGASSVCDLDPAALAHMLIRPQTSACPRYSKKIPREWCYVHVVCTMYFRARALPIEKTQNAMTLLAMNSCRNQTTIDFFSQRSLLLRSAGRKTTW
jgi:hypothetical protein